MKKIFIVIVVLFVLFACGDDDSDNSTTTICYSCDRSRIEIVMGIEVQVTDKQETCDENKKNMFETQGYTCKEKQN